MVSGVWTWLRNYRVWAANVKVFLWPENWLNPDSTRLRRHRKGRP
jgi:ABC toxin-like protein